MKYLIALISLGWLFYLSAYGGNILNSDLYHDPSLDSINNTAIQIDADLNFMGQNLPDAIANTNEIHAQNYINSSYGAYMTNQHPDSVSAHAMSNNAASFAASVSNSLLFASLALNPTNFTSLTNYDGGYTNANHNLEIIDLGSFWSGSGHMYMDLSPANFSNPGTGVPWINASLAPAFRGFIIAIVLFLHFQLLLSYYHEEIKGIMGQRQLTGNASSLMGTNLSGLTGVLYAAIITALIATAAVGLCAGLTLGTGSDITSSTSTIKTYISQTASILPAWDVITTFFPASTILYTVISYAFFRYLVGFPLVVGVRSVILFLLA